ncbi:hypothetical protein EMIHUDRAFT_213644 [Emiliania huxleyi CCMP1516]|uniref:Peptidase A1 domain-containing protein n=2 Tax=Emiliania huxleyi TaxID=2903 RepID=A0A0D3IMC1_EMIH1|nr:hypothetical protein EMIHUDRAFT_213644 [Emiliania huxleyi CCMP1516]EOD12406.1 hypothetical protein EMIHUDRAFT_213644 [Emiliania huxleyi CCMP1516]|eukprot:XP_005764835.1 hypothetical protein EMIHUDRAFT_213644 [Emiliania huxleyi CCMP1516]
MRLTRLPLLRGAAVALLSLSPLAPPPPPAAAAVAASARPVVVPLTLCGGAYCVRYTLDGQPFRAIVDTGSPFLLVDGTCTEASEWGCYRGAGRASGLDDTEEEFGGQITGTQWRVGYMSLLGENAALVLPETTFGVVRTYTGKGGSGAVFLGLAKRRLPRIRPTFLEQTSVASLQFDFLRGSLTLSPRPLIPRGTDAIRLLDLRPRGAPISAAVCRIRRLYVNGELLQLDRPAVAVIDTGTTGLSVSESLFCAADGPLGPIRDCRVELVTEQGRVCALEASVRRRQVPSRFGDVPLVDVPDGAPESDAFPLVVSPVDVPWFEQDFGQGDALEQRVQAEAARDDALGDPYRACQARVQRAATRGAAPGEPLSRLDGLGERPHVLFVGLAFFWRRQLTIDVDDGRLAFV